METAPILVPAPAIVEERQKKSKPVIIQPPEVSAAHDMAVIAFILTWLAFHSMGASSAGHRRNRSRSIPRLRHPTSSDPCLSAGRTFPRRIPRVHHIRSFAIIPTLHRPRRRSIAHRPHLPRNPLLLHSSNINVGRYQKARNAALLFGVLFILPTFFVLFAPAQIFGVVIAIIPAFFLLMAYGRLGEVVAKYGPVAIMGEAAPGMCFGDLQVLWV